jgi:hypothetical protein
VHSRVRSRQRKFKVFGETTHGPATRVDVTEESIKLGRVRQCNFEAERVKYVDGTASTTWAVHPFAGQAMLE